MIRTRAVHAVATGLVAAVLVGGCGGGSGYCDGVRSHQADLGDIVHGSDRGALLEALPIFEDLRDQAPDDVAADWQLLVTRISALRKALQDAGVAAATYAPAKPPPGLDATERTRIRDAAAQLAAGDTQQALGAVQQEVLDVCHTPLDL